MGVRLPSSPHAQKKRFSSVSSLPLRFNSHTSNSSLECEQLTSTLLLLSIRVPTVLTAIMSTPAASHPHRRSTEIMKQMWTWISCRLSEDNSTTTTTEDTSATKKEKKRRSKEQKQKLEVVSTPKGQHWTEYSPNDDMWTQPWGQPART